MNNRIEASAKIIVTLVNRLNPTEEEKTLALLETEMWLNSISGLRVKDLGIIEIRFHIQGDKK